MNAAPLAKAPCWLRPGAKPTHFRINVTETKAGWTGELLMFMEAERWECGDRRFKASKKICKTKENFEDWLIEQVRVGILKLAERGLILYPLNFAEKFNSPEFVSQLNKRASNKSRKRDPVKKFILDSIGRNMRENWHKKDRRILTNPKGKSLADLSRKELFEHFAGYGRTLKKLSPSSSPITPDEVYRVAFEAGLIPKRQRL